MSPLPATSNTAHATASFQGRAFPYCVIRSESPTEDPILMLGGAFQSMRGLRRFARCFLDRHDVVLVDLPGSGDTDPLGPEYGSEFLADCAAATLRAAGIYRAAVVGVSFGSAVAERIAG